MVNNFDLIQSLLIWENEGEYYYVQLLHRKVDGTTVHGNKNNSARLIKTYCFYNIEQFLDKKEEIIATCEFHKCRAYINLNKRNNERVAFELLKQIVERITSKNYKGINGLLNTVNGAPISSDKYWLIDCDTEIEYGTAFTILNSNDIRPEGNKIVAIIPTYSSKHIITTRFDRKLFDEMCVKELKSTISIHKNNPTCLYFFDKTL